MSKQNKTIQDNIDKLAELVAWFDGDDFELEKAIDMYKQAESLAETIEHDLRELKNDINVIKQKFDDSSKMN